MKLTDLGEREIIKRIAPLLSTAENTLEIGDDCAVIDLGKNLLLITTDMVNAETHLPEEITPWQIGWFSIAVNLSDIAAKGGTPYGLVLALGLPRSLDEDFIKELVEGANSCATTYDTAIVGGDTKETRFITITGTAVGIVPKGEFMSRVGAKVGDLVAVTGNLGKAAAGYYALKHDIKGKKELAQGLMEPTPRLPEGRVLASTGAVTSCMDISDGLSSSLYQLQEANNVGFEIDFSNIPISEEISELRSHVDVDVPDFALHFGGDYELLLTLTPSRFKDAQDVLEKSGGSLTCIGRVIDGEKIYLTSQEGKQILPNKGYEHFTDKTIRF